jgi:integrase/recombinase XerD
MLSRFFDSGARVHALRSGFSGPFVDGFAHALAQAGYAPITARRHLRAAEHLLSWAAQKAIPVGNLTQQAVAGFARHVPRCRCRRFGRSDRSLVHGAALFQKYLQEIGAVGVSTVASPICEPAPLIGFREWMHRQRGTCAATLDNYTLPIRTLLTRLGEDLSRLDARTLRQFVIEGSQTCGWSAAKKRTTALRMFLRYLIAEGKCPSELEGAVPTLAHWHLSALPRYLPENDVERLIASCDPASPVGRRDRVILLLLARLGLRAGDIVQLQLDDIDWKGSRIVVSGKGRRQTPLPLTQEVGHALVSYLRSARPPTNDRAVFMRSRAPFGPFRSHCAVSVIVDRALRRAGVARPSRGAAHLLRHSVATSMLRHGACLKDVAALLRHQSIATTQIYAKVDVSALQAIAQPWPQVHP